MSERVLLEADFGEGCPGVRLLAGDPANHCFRVKHNYVILYDENGAVTQEWFYEDTHPMNFMESYWRFGTEVEKLFDSLRDNSDDVMIADLYSESIHDGEDEYK